jgi:hypothetical protein
MPFDVSQHNDDILTAVQNHHLDFRARIQALLLRHPDVKSASNQALAAGIPWATILVTILPFVMQILAGGKIDWQAIVTAILALIHPAPTPLHGTNMKA